ncbi:MAG TPA: pirin family protein, partial [Bacteroidia bacterium]|nr:pirin family protein [Bacteroidia bacterium]
QIISPEENATNLWIHQDAWFHMGNFDKGKKVDYTIKKKGNGVYAFILEGDFTINGEKLSRRDGMGISDTDKVSIEATSDKAEILLMEIPMA